MYAKEVNNDNSNDDNNSNKLAIQNYLNSSINSENIIKLLIFPSSVFDFVN